MYLLYLIGSVVFLVVSQLVSFEISFLNEDTYALLLVTKQQDEHNLPTPQQKSGNNHQSGLNAVFDIEPLLNDFIFKVCGRNVTFVDSGNFRVGLVMDLNIKNIRDLKFVPLENLMDLTTKNLLNVDTYSNQKIQRNEKSNTNTSKLEEITALVNIPKEQFLLDIPEDTLKNTDIDIPSSFSLQNVDKDNSKSLSKAPKTKVSNRIDSMPSINASVDDSKTIQIKGVLFKIPTANNRNESLLNIIQGTFGTRPGKYSNLTSKYIEFIIKLRNASLFIPKPLKRAYSELKSITKQYQQDYTPYLWLIWKNFNADISNMFESFVKSVKGYTKSLVSERDHSNDSYLSWNYLTTYTKFLIDVFKSTMSTNILINLTYLSMLIVCYLHLVDRIKKQEIERSSSLQQVNLLKSDTNSKILTIYKILYTLRKDLNSMQEINEKALLKCKQGVDLHLKMTKTNLDTLKRIYETIEKRQFDTEAVEPTIRALLEEKINGHAEIVNSNNIKRLQTPQSPVIKMSNGHGEYDSSDASSPERLPQPLYNCCHNELNGKPKQKTRTKWTVQNSLK